MKKNVVFICANNLIADIFYFINLFSMMHPDLMAFS